MLDYLTMAHQQASMGKVVILFAPTPDDAIHYYEEFSQFFGVERIITEHDSLAYRVRGNGCVCFRVGVAPVSTNEGAGG